MLVAAKPGFARELVKNPVSETLKLLAERELYEFVKQAWPLIEPGKVFIDGWHIKAICEHLQALTRGQIRNLVINVPPMHAKSIIVAVMWPAWEWIASNAASRWLCFSYSQRLSERDSMKCRNIIKSPWYRQRWGNKLHIINDMDAKQKFENDKHGYRLASSISGLATGEHGDYIVVDDPHSIREIESEQKRESVIFWWTNVMPTRGADPKTSRRAIIMQRSHEKDLAGYIKENGSDWTWLVLPAEFEKENPCTTSIGFKDKRKQEGELLWPEFYGRKEIDALKKELGSYATAAQLQQRPSPAKGGIFKRAWFKNFYMARPPIEQFSSVFQSWDMAFKELKSSDYVSGGVWGVMGANLYLLDRINEQLSFTETCSAVEAMTAKWPQATAKYVEDKANGPAVIDALKKKIPGIIGVNPQGPKESRAYAITPYIEAGNLWLPHHNLFSWVEEYIEEMCSFPTGGNDDDVDMTTQAFLKAQDGRHQPVGQIISIKKDPSPWRRT